MTTQVREQRRHIAFQMDRIHLNKGATALVVMSGGQDSTTCLGLAIHRHGADNVSAVIFDYGQKHAVEMLQAKLICDTYGVELITISLPILQHMKSSSLVTGGDTSTKHEYLDGVPSTFVPARNALFLTSAWGLAMEHKIEIIYTGVCQTDFSGYPDCRWEFIRALQDTLRIGYETDIAIVTPLMFLDKASTFELARRCDVLLDVVELSHTCYNGVRDVKHAWGYGCGECPACKLRLEGYAEFVTRYNDV